MDTSLRRTWAEIDLDALAYNYHQIRKATGPNVKFLGVVKGDGYGHGAIQVSRELVQLGADYLAVSSMDEAKELRVHGIQAPIMIFGYTPPEMVPQLILHGITQTVPSESAAEQYSAAASAIGGRLKVHIKVDTGLSRLGFLVRGNQFSEGVESILRTCEFPGLDAEGIYTHFAVADEDDAESEAYTQEQFALFNTVLQALKMKGRTFEIKHCACSGALARYPEMYQDMVRPGIALYGAGPDVERLGVKPVMTFKSCVSTIKILDKNSGISYGRTFRAPQEVRAGVLPVGFADGLMRGLSNKLSVQTSWGPAPVRGRICMDMSIIDLSQLPQMQVGSEVEIFGQKQHVNTVAEMLGTIPNELFVAVSKRVPRLYMKDHEVVERVLRILG